MQVSIYIVHLIIYRVLSRCLITACTHLAIVGDARDTESVMKNWSNVFCLISKGSEDKDSLGSYTNTRTRYYKFNSTKALNYF